MLRLSVVIPTFNRKDSIIHVLKLLEKRVIKNIDLSIIVIVDGSTDGTLEAIQSLFSDVIIIEGDGNWWWTRSVNEGCKAALKNGSDAVLLLNDDITFDSNYLENILKSIEKEPDAIIGSLNVTEEKERRIYFSGAKKIRCWDGKLQRYHTFLSLYKKNNLSGLQKSIVLPGRGLFIPSWVFKKIGFFDEKALPQYKADYDFVLRANKNNIHSFISWDSIIFSYVETTGKGSTFTRQSLFAFCISLFQKKSRTNFFQNFLYYKRHLPLWSLPLFPFTALMILMRHFFLFFKERKY